MSNLNHPTRRQALFTVTGVAAAALLAACGGGGDGAAPVATATPAAPTTASTFTLGAITGFGSVIVGGVRFDDSRAAFVDEDDVAFDRNRLRLGMMVALDAGAVNRADASALALRIRLGSEIVGPVGTIDTAAATVQVLGQTVLVNTSTLFDETLAGGLSALRAGQVVEVYGILDPANGRVVATRIEAEDAASAYKLRGQIANLDTTAKTFTLNGQLISYTGLPAATVPPGLTNGQIVRVRLQTTQVNGAWVATALRGGLRLPDRSGEAHLEGMITAFTSTAAFSVNGLPVDASAASFPDGTAGVALGAKVEVEGTVTNGVLVATKVEVEEHRPQFQRQLELRGELGNLNTTDKTFALRGVTVWYGGTVEWRDGVEATLANGRRVEVRGVLSTDRTRLEARRVEFK
ncbi:MAG: hypothetical protein C0505_02085 [Leptothrix sp. (in: Bacteria)]|nr:hypothetical protein [Leptothrix sp. (in: b-proteobacteria)]